MLGVGCAIEGIGLLTIMQSSLRFAVSSESSGWRNFCERFARAFGSRLRFLGPVL